MIEVIESRWKSEPAQPHGPYRFYTFNQNNSGGRFVCDGIVAHYVCIEAANANEANSIAEGVGLYFDGEGDCPCCGDRWSPTHNDDGTETPSIYGDPISERVGGMFRSEVVIYFRDGLKQHLKAKA